MNKRNYHLLNSNKEMLLQRLNDLGKENMNKLKESEIRLLEQICSLQKMTAELENKCGKYTLMVLQVRFQKWSSLENLRNEKWTVLMKGQF